MKRFSCTICRIDEQQSILFNKGKVQVASSLYHYVSLGNQTPDLGGANTLP